MNDILVYLHFILEDPNKIFDIINNRQKLDSIDKEAVRRYVNSLPYNYITIYDEKYYELVSQIENPPLVIYYYGNLQLLNANPILLMSDKYPSKYALDVCSDYIRINDETYVVTCQHGISSQVCASSVVNKRPVIYFVDKPLDSVLSDCSKRYNYIIEQGLLISFTANYKNEVTYEHKYWNILHFIKKLVIIEAEKSSKLNKVVSMSFEHNIDVYALPARVYDYKMSGNNMLIKDGAQILELNS